MRRVKKQLVELLSSLSSSEIKQLHLKLVAPKLRSLRREKNAIEKRLHEIEREIAGLAPTKKRKARQPKRLRKAKRVRRARRGTVLSKIKNVLQRASVPMRVKEVCNALVRAGMPKKKGLVNYVNRILSTNANFTKVGWGLYSIAGQAPASVSKKSS